MKRSYLISAIFFMSCILAIDAQYSIFEIPDSLMTGSAVIRKEASTLTVYSPKEYTFEYQAVITILQEDSDLTNLIVRYGKYSKAKILHARIYDAHGREVRSIKKEEIDDRSAIDGFSVANDARYLYADLSYPEYPYTIEVRYRQEHKQTMAYPGWRLPIGSSAQEVSFTLNQPEDMTIHVQSSNAHFMTEESLDKATRNRSWTAKNIQATQAEFFAPPTYTYQPYLTVSPGRFQVEGYTGSMDSWNLFGKFMHDINKGRATLTPEMAEKVQALISEAESDREKIEILYAYLQKHMRYVSVQIGIGGWQSFDARYVEENQYGDCKALSHFMKGMLAEAGIESQCVLIRNGRDRPPMDSIADSYFNHMILRVPAEEMWLECTNPTIPAGYLGKGNSDRPVLLITPDGGEVRRTPAGPLVNNTISTHDSIIFDPSGTVSLVGSAVYEGAAHEVCRLVEFYLAGDEQEKRFLQNFPQSVEKLHRLKYNSDQAKPVSTCHYEMDLSKFGSKSGKRLFIPMNPVRPFQNPFPVDEQRQLDVYYDSRKTEHNTITFSIPEGYEVEHLPATKNWNSEYGIFEMEAAVHGKSITVTRKHQHHMFSAPAEEYNEVRDFFKKIEKADRSKIVLVAS